MSGPVPGSATAPPGGSSDGPGASPGSSAALTRDHTSGGRRVDVATALLVIVAAAGVAIRIGFWWQDRAFWRDELSLVQSLDTYSWAQLLGPLSDAQAAPPMWLWAERAVTLVLGTGELAYRLLPMLAGCVAVVLVALLATRFVRDRWVAVVPVVLVATIAEAVFYGAQTKQYTTDLALVAALLLVATSVLDNRGRVRYAWYVALAVFPWFSHGAMLTVPLLAAWIAVVRLHRKQTGLGREAALLVVPAVSTLLAALRARELTSMVSDFTSYWSSYLGPRSTDPADWLDWHGYVFRELGTRLLGAPVWWAPLLITAVGVAALWRRERALAVLIVVPVFAAYVAAVAGFYPFGRRLGLFFLPSFALAIGVFVDATAALAARFARRIGRERWTAAPPRLVGGLTATALVAATCWMTPGELAERLRYQYGIDDYRTAFEWVAEHWEEGDLLLVGNEDRTAARVYGPRLGLPADAMFRAMPASSRAKRDDCPLPAPIAQTRRAWLVTGDLVEIYRGVTSRYALVAPMIGRFHVIYQHVRGQVTVQLVEAERPPKRTNAHTVRCLDYAPVGKAGDPRFPPRLEP